MRFKSKHAVMALSILFAAILFSCSKKDNPVDPDPSPQPSNLLVGTWGTSSITADDVEVTPGNDPYNLLVNHGLYTFYSNGTGSAIFTYGSSSMSFSWSINGSYININGYQMEFILNGDTFTTIEPSTTEDGIRHPKVETVYLRSHQLSLIPVLTTSVVSTVTQTSAQCGGNITSDGGSPVTMRGVCWSTSSTPTIFDNKTINGSGIGSFTSSLVGLVAGTTYYVRAYASNSTGTGYGIVQTFTTDSQSGTDSTGTVTDIDGNTYHTIKIGEQWWMMENLEVTNYRNGDPIPNVTSDSSWSELSSGAYCDYKNNIDYVVTYGRLYNWYAVADSRNIAPEGWHVPTDAEWQTLIDYLGGSSVAGGKLKETGTAHWYSPNTGATNESGFSGLPGGRRYSWGYFDDMGYYARFWSSTEYDSSEARFRVLFFDFSVCTNELRTKQWGFSVRCIKD